MQGQEASFAQLQQRVAELELKLAGNKTPPSE
jgi:hypothetical protein